MKKIKIKKARLHNLKNIDISIPKNRLIAVTGISGSGKSSLIFDIVFEEGRKQYLQSLGVLTEIDDEEKFDAISGISPTIAVQQNIIRQSNTRATLGTKTNIQNMLALLFAKEGKLLCPTCGTLTDENQVCNRCSTAVERLPVGYFSYNNPNGMCFTCSGKGAYYEINMDKLLPSEQTSLEQIVRAIKISSGLANVLRRNFKEYMKIPFQQLPDEVKDDIINGHYVNGNFQKRSFCLTRFFQGLIFKGEDLTGIYEKTGCRECHGFRIGKEARRVLLNNRHIGELGMMTIEELYSFLKDIQKQYTMNPSSTILLKEILLKIRSLITSRLGHLSLYRDLPSLSGGELQRLFLNTHLDSKMDSLIYILDEPTAGLHESEKEELLQSIIALKDIGNTVIVVEHEKKIINRADYIIDIGPKAGVEGGSIIYEGPLSGLLKCPQSITGRYLSLKEALPQRQKIEISDHTPSLIIYNARTNNLRDVTVSIPLGAMVGIAGVSGSGKSSLICDTLIPLLRGAFGRKDRICPDDPESIEEEESMFVETRANKINGINHISGYAEVSQSPIGRKMSSNPITYTGGWDKIRKLFAQQPDAMQKGLSAGHFSFNSKGACPACGGSGHEKIWMGGNFFIYNTCGQCNGKRFCEETLSIYFKNKNIYDILKMSVSEAVLLFEDEPVDIRTLKVLKQIGMGYITLGQPTPGLSGGESQRIKLAREIAKKQRGNILYVLDEPTVGLSPYDIARLIQLLDELVKKGNSVIVIEHDTEVLSLCDWVIELGPKGGNEGGKIIAEGTPCSLNGNRESIVGKYLN